MTVGIDGVLVLSPQVHGDARGSFAELWRRDLLPGAPEMVQANRADRRAGTVVGLHYHRHQTDVWHVVAGRVRIVLHDLRVGSPTDGATVSFDLGANPGDPLDARVVVIPPGVAHGFAARTDVVLAYLVDRAYDPADELGIAWDDPDVAAPWDVEHPVVSGRDQRNPRRGELSEDERPSWRPAVPAPGTA